MSTIVDAIDAERTSLKEEIEGLEAQLEGKRSHLGTLDELRERAEEIGATGGGMVAEAPPKPAAVEEPQPRPTGRRRQSDVEGSVLALLERSADTGRAPREVEAELGLSSHQARTALASLKKAGAIRTEGAPRSLRYFSKEGSSRPSEAPAPGGGGAAGAAVLPPRRSGGARNDTAAAEHNNMTRRLKTAIVELLADGPLTGSEITAAVLKRIPGATSQQIANARTTLSRKGKIEQIGDRFHAGNRDTTGKLVTGLERTIVARLLPDGATAEEVGEVVRGGRGAALSYLIALERREVVWRRPGTEPVVFESLIGAPA